MAFTLFRTSAGRFLANFERNLTNANLRSGKNKISFCGCASVTFLDNQSRTFATRKYSEFTKPQTERKYEYDTDSDVEISKKAGESQFWRRKMRTFHGILDVNKDGVISFDDFQLLADRFVNLGHMSEGKAFEFRELIKVCTFLIFVNNCYFLKKIWEKQWGEIEPYNLVTVEQYLEDMLHVVNDKDRAKKVHSFLPYLFEAIDKDKTGEITIEQYKLFYECLGLTDEDAVFSFRVMDADADGTINMKEFVHHGREFFLCEDESMISKYFWGPLVPK
ncbi:HLH domain-containing protein [Oryctes borbonicus]|uniref:HLH domain-containing protein n=1 Tax=Oryctes borbonicus TaxID=1629725 RepID=A0A0T6BEF5_9SCAR|nr:HLH domain-containing protein [Oryctes borbonicus]